MTTKELINELKQLDFVGKVIEEAIYVEVFSISENCIASIDKINTHSINTDKWCFDNLKTTEKQQLFDVLCEYAKTPIKDREEKKLYTVTSKIDSTRILCRIEGTGYRVRGIGFKVPYEITTEFTEEELKNVNGINLWNSDEWLIEEV